MIQRYEVIGKINFEHVTMMDTTSPKGPQSSESWTLMQFFKR